MPSDCECHVTDLEGSLCIPARLFLWMRRLPFVIVIYRNYSFSISFSSKGLPCAACFCCNLYFIYEQIIDVKCSPFRLLFYLFVDVLIILLRRDYFSRPWRSSGTFVRCPFWRWFTRKVHKSMEVLMNKTWIILNNFPSTGRFCFKLDDLQFTLSFCIVFFYFTLRKER